MSLVQDVNRRVFLKSGSALALHQLLPKPDLPHPADQPSAHARRTKLSPMPYHSVRLAPGIAEQQRLDTVAVLLSLTDDELLKPFRERSGKAAPGKAIGGWYDAHAYCPGHTFGQWLSAHVRTYAIQPNPALQKRINGLVTGLASSFDDTGAFFATDNRFPAYTLEKLNCGLVDAIAFANDPQAAEVLLQINRLAQPHLPEKALSRAEQRKRTTRDVTYTYDETYTLPENYFLAFQRTGDPYYRDLALKFMHHEFLDPLSRNENVLSGLHAYSHLNTLNSAAQAYLTLGDEQALAAAVNGFAFVQQQSYANGGWGPNEAFITPGRGELAQSLHTTHSSFETPCGAYGHFKITRSLLSITGDASYGDSMEAVMLNTILGSLPLQPNGDAFYYADFSMQATKLYHGTRWPCCSGTLAQAASDYRINAYLEGADGLYVNLYTPSTVTYVDRGVAIELQQSGTYPLDGRVDIAVRPHAPASFALHVRVPAWSGGKVVAKVNGKTVSLSTPIKDVASFATIERHWHPGDRLTLEFPMSLRLQPVAPESPNLVALLRGPVMLYGLGAPARTHENALLTAAQSTSTEWIVKTESGDRLFTTFDRIGTQTYSAYSELI